jgi:hypothetical protein
MGIDNRVVQNYSLRVYKMTYLLNNQRYQYVWHFTSIFKYMSFKDKMHTSVGVSLDFLRSVRLNVFH